jgi:hypothetical protein
VASKNLDETALTADVTSTTQNTISVVSATGFAVGNLAHINGETMQIRSSYDGTALVVPVTRGTSSSARTHPSNSMVYCGPEREFYSNDKSGRAVTGDEYALPHINIKNGRVFDIANEWWYERLPQAQAGLDALTPTSSDSPGVNMVRPDVTVVRLGANVSGATDFVTLPVLADVPNGHQVTIIAGSVGCEVRTPATSGEEINSEDCDGTKEYILAATQVHYFTKIDSTIGWLGHGFTAIGAVATAIVPD